MVILYLLHISARSVSLTICILTCRYVSLEDFENGIKSYQSALRIDARHYNSWYGLGMIYFRQEKFEFSEHHFRMGFQINPRSSVIMSYLGTVLHALKVRLLLVLVIASGSITLVVKSSEIWLLII